MNSRTATARLLTITALASIAAAGAMIGSTGDAHAHHRADVVLAATVLGPRPADDPDGDFDPNRRPGGGAYGPYTCKAGFVWRDSYEGDHLCVTPDERKKAHDDNPDRQPGGGAYGPYTCKPGFVWRDSYDGDYACVTPRERDDEKREAGRS